MTEYYFRAEKVSVGYNGVPLVKEIGIGLEKGSILTLIGPNGAGKSTVLKSIAKQLPLTAGAIYLDGRGISGISGAELSRKMAVLLTEKLRTEMMTCEEVVETGRYPYTGYFGRLSDSDHRAVEEALELVHVAGIRDRDFAHISDGQRQRVMLARAICQEPEILILDEPTSYLDIRHKLEFLSILQEMRRKKGLTVIMSLHELELAARVSDKLLCLNGEAVDRFGSPEEVFEQGYLSRLFSVSAGSFDEENGSVELEAVKGEAGIFVIAGAGTGRAVYRRLQREGRAFVTGILFENDLDYPVARALAAEVFAGKSFEPISGGLLEKAKKKMAACKHVVCCRNEFGTYEAENRELLEYAVQSGKMIEYAAEKKEGSAGSTRTWQG